MTEKTATTKQTDHMYAFRNYNEYSDSPKILQGISELWWSCIGQTTRSHQWCRPFSVSLTAKALFHREVCLCTWDPKIAILLPTFQLIKIQIGLGISTCKTPELAEHSDSFQFLATSLLNSHSSLVHLFDSQSDTNNHNPNVHSKATKPSKFSIIYDFYTMSHLRQLVVKQRWRQGKCPLCKKAYHHLSQHLLNAKQHKGLSTLDRQVVLFQHRRKQIFDLCICS